MSRRIRLSLFTMALLAWLLLRASRAQDAFAVNMLGVRSLSVLRRVPVRLDTFANPEELSGREFAFLAFLAEFQGLSESAVNYLEKATQLPSARQVWWFRLADLYYHSGRPDKIWATLGQIEERDHLFSYQCQSSLHPPVDLEQADRWCPLLENIAAPSTREDCLLARYYLSTGQLAESELLFEHSASQPDVDDHCLYQYGRLFFRQKQYVEAELFYERAFEKNPLPLYQRAMAEVYAQTERMTLAIETYQRVHTLNPRGKQCAETLYGLGKVYYYQVQDYQQASYWFKAAIDCDPSTYTYAYYLLAESKRLLGHPEEALQAYQVIEERAAGSTRWLELRHEYAAYLIELGRVASAEEIYLSILKDAPDDPVAKSFIQESGG